MPIPVMPPFAVVAGYPATAVPCALTSLPMVMRAAQAIEATTQQLRKPSMALNSLTIQFALFVAVCLHGQNKPISSTSHLDCASLLHYLFDAKRIVKTLKNQSFLTCPSFVNCVKLEVSPFSLVSLEQ
jgi:hypothetical protein